MEYIYAAMLLHKAGKEITDEALKSVLSSAGVNVDEGRVKATVSALKGINIEDAIASASITPITAVAEPTAPVKEEKKEEAPKEEKKSASSEEAAAGLGALFG